MQAGKWLLGCLATHLPREPSVRRLRRSNFAARSPQTLGQLGRKSRAHQRGGDAETLALRRQSGDARLLAASM